MNLAEFIVAWVSEGIDVWDLDETSIRVVLFDVLESSGPSSEWKRVLSLA